MIGRVATRAHHLSAESCQPPVPNPELAKVRLVIEGEMANDRMTLKAALKAGARPSAGLAEAVSASIRDIAKLRGDVQWVEADQLPNDGKVIEDARKYD